MMDEDRQLAHVSATLAVERANGERERGIRDQQITALLSALTQREAFVERLAGLLVRTFNYLPANNYRGLKAEIDAALTQSRNNLRGQHD